MQKLTVAGIFSHRMIKKIRRLFLLVYKTNVFQIIYILFIVLLLSFWLSNNKTINKLSDNINSIYPATVKSDIAAIVIDDTENYSCNDITDLFIKYLFDIRFIITEADFEFIIFQINKYSKTFLYKTDKFSSLLSGKGLRNYISNIIISNYPPPTFFTDRLRI